MCRANPVYTSNIKTIALLIWCSLYKDYTVQTTVLMSERRNYHRRGLVRQSLQDQNSTLQYICYQDLLTCADYVLLSTWHSQEATGERDPQLKSSLHQMSPVEMSTKDYLDWWWMCEGLYHYAIPWQVAVDYVRILAESKPIGVFLHDSCFSSWHDFPHWWTVIWKCKPNNPFLPKWL